MALENILYGIVSALKIFLGHANCFTLARAFNSEHQVDLPFFLAGTLVIHYLSDGTYQRMLSTFCRGQRLSSTGTTVASPHTISLIWILE